MTKCEVCGENVLLPFQCNFCGGYFCVAHRLPENHDCPCAPPRTPLGPWYAKKVPIPMAKLPKGKKVTVSEGKFHFVKKAQNVKRQRTWTRIVKAVGIGVISLIIVGVFVFFVVLIDRTPPTIRIISPTTKIYDVNTISLTYTVNEPTSWMGYNLNDAESITLTGNTTLSSLPTGRYNLTIYANDTAGNVGSSKVSFTVTNVFSSLNGLISFLRDDDLSDAEWTVNYTCHEFAEDFIQRAETKGYYCFTYYALSEDERDMYADALESIRVVKTYVGGTVIWQYDVSEAWRASLRMLGHAVVRTTVDGTDVIVDPQTDIILTMNDFTVLYEGEITQD